ncbi:MAG: histidine phosphatase family protein [Actinobacteria bacterium]|nr:histidine phosphatase family protein [Actinomycetota bacterium]
MPTVSQVPYLMPPRATELILVRHGATEPARPEVSFPLVEGRGDPTLTGTGIAQAGAVAAKLRGEPLAGIFVTPLRRTAETAAPLARAICVEPIEVPELTEVHFGEMEGGRYQLRAAAGDPAIRRAFVEQRWDAIPGAESAADLSSRIRAGLDRVVAAVGPGAAAVVVSHGGTIGELCSQALGAEPLSLVHADNCSISRLIVFPSGRRLLRSFNEIGHLA